MISAKKAMQRAFCKDLCEELIIDKNLSPVYPAWAMILAYHMIRLGWAKTKTTEESQG